MKYILQYDANLHYVNGTIVRAKQGYEISASHYAQIRKESQSFFEKSEEPLNRIELAQYRQDMKDLAIKEAIKEELEALKDKKELETPKEEVEIAVKVIKNKRKPKK